MKGAELRAMRKAAGLRANQIAARLGYTKQHWSRLENDHARIHPVIEAAARWVCSPAFPEEMIEVMAERDQAKLSLYEINQKLAGKDGELATLIRQICERGIG